MERKELEKRIDEDLEIIKDPKRTEREKNEAVFDAIDCQEAYQEKYERMYKPNHDMDDERRYGW